VLTISPIVLSLVKSLDSSTTKPTKLPTLSSKSKNLKISPKKKGAQIFGEEKLDYDSLGEEDNDEESYCTIFKRYTSVEQHQTCKGVLGESTKKDYTNAQLLPNLNPYLSLSKITNINLSFHKHEPSSKDYVDQGSLNALNSLYPCIIK
jgi:nucleoside-specific outer membrane channel protein Tsx